MQKALSLSQAAATGEHVTLGLRVESLRLPVPRLSSADDHTLSWPRKVQTRSYKRPSQPVACRSGAGMGEKYIGCEMWTMLTAILIFNHLVLVLPSSKEEEQRSGSAPLSPPLSREIKRFESLIDQDPKNISLKYTVGLLYQLAGRPQEVCDYLYSAYRMDPDRASPELFFHLANNLKAIGETEAAVNFYALAIGASPIGPVNWVLMAIALDFLGHPDLALKGYQALSQFLNTKFCKGRGKQQRTVPGEIQESDRLGRQRVGERDGTDRVRGICHGKFFREFGRANVCKRAPCRLTSIPSLPLPPSLSLPPSLPFPPSLLRLSLYPRLSLAPSLFLPPSLPSLAPSLPRSPAPSLARLLACLLAPSFPPSLARSLARSLPPSLPPSLPLALSRARAICSLPLSLPYRSLSPDLLRTPGIPVSL